MPCRSYWFGAIQVLLAPHLTFPPPHSPCHQLGPQAVQKVLFLQKHWASSLSPLIDQVLLLKKENRGHGESSGTRPDTRRHRYDFLNVLFSMNALSIANTSHCMTEGYSIFAAVTAVRSWRSSWNKRWQPVGTLCWLRTDYLLQCVKRGGGTLWEHDCNIGSLQGTSPQCLRPVTG